MAKRMFFFPWYIILLPFFFLLNTSNKFFKLLPISLFIQFLAASALTSLFLFLVTKLFLKNKVRSGIFVFALQIIYLFWGTMHDFLKNIHILRALTSYSTLFILTFLALLAILLYLKKSRKEFIVFHRFLNLLLVILAGADLITALYKSVTHAEKKYQYPEMNAISLTNRDTLLLKPDIFFIIFDEYASSKALSKYYYFDNSKLDSLLAKNNFFLANNSKSNYNSTPLSLGSTLNLQYDPQNMEGKFADAQVLLKGTSNIKKSVIPELFKKQGYKISNFGVFDIDNYPTQTEPHFYSYQKNVLLGQTLWERMKKDVFWNFSKVIERDVSQPTKTTKENNINLSLLLKELRKANSDTARFVITHFMLPHTPFDHDRHGNKRIFSDADQAYPIYDSLYVDNVIYANSFIDSIVNSMNTVHTRPFALIIMSDHGERHFEKGKPLIREKQFMNLAAYYFSDGQYNMLYDSISPVNTFRVILNKYFQANLPLPKDSTVMLIN